MQHTIIFFIKDW